MGNKLPFEEQGKSHLAVNDLEEFTGLYNFKANVHVYNKSLILLMELKNINVFIGDGSVFRRISVMWEEVGFTKAGFNEYGLYGLYYPDYCKMKFTNGVFEIDADEKLIKIFIR